MTWPESLSDKEMGELFSQFMTVALESDPACSVEIHGEDLALFVPSGRGRGE